MAYYVLYTALALETVAFAVMIYYSFVINPPREDDEDGKRYLDFDI